MFQNPIKHFSKQKLNIHDALLLLMVANWLLMPYRGAVADLFADWLPTFYLLFGVSFLNLIVFIIVLLVAADRSENWWEGKQPQSAWRKAYLETVENVPVQSIWKEKLMNVWLVLLLASFIIFLIGVFSKLILASSPFVFIYYFIAYFIGLLLMKLGNFKWK